jgi:hypothetical protein
MAWQTPRPGKRASKALHNLDAKTQEMNCRRRKLDWHDDALAEESATGGHFSGTALSIQVLPDAIVSKYASAGSSGPEASGFRSSGPDWPRSGGDQRRNS